MPSLPIALALFLACLLPSLATAQGTCLDPVPMQFNDEGGPHSAQCTDLIFSHYPPTSGRHYANWAAFRTYPFILNAGNWLHAMEHGAVVFLINCRKPGDCLGDFARLQAFADSLPVDPVCDAATKRRVIITGDSLITTRFAVVAWNWSLQSDCLDTAAFASFYKAHYAQAPEDLCLPGEAYQEQGGCNGPLAISRWPQAKHGNLGPGRLSARGWLSEKVFDLQGRAVEPGEADLSESLLLPRP